MAGVAFNTELASGQQTYHLTVDSYRHPLLDLSSTVKSQLTNEDMTPLDFPQCSESSWKQRIKGDIGRRVYPWKNRVERPIVEGRLREAGAEWANTPRPEILAWGHKGMGPEIFLSAVAKRVGEIDTVACVGCGTGYEFLNIAHFLSPRRIVGYEYFNYDRAWNWVSRELASKNIAVDFYQCDLRKSLPTDTEQCDLLISFEVLEHFRSMSEIFSNLQPLLARDGWFAALWGPMWYSFSGDHIAAELGFEKGYEHVRLSPDEYVSFYKTHPRNAAEVEKGTPTWLELGLHNFARYEEYLVEIKRSFGEIKWLVLSVSIEGWKWRTVFSDKWELILKNNSHLQPMDLLIQSACVLSRRLSV
jgi:SAM-dependent methyltransferase